MRYFIKHIIVFYKFEDWWKDDLNIADAEPASSTRLDDSSVNSFIDGQKAEKTVKKQSRIWKHGIGGVKALDELIK